MKTRIFTFFLIGVAFVSCTLDSNLFNPEELDKYQLPGNTIPLHLIEEVEMNSNGFKIYGFWIASNSQRPGITMLYCHGNKHNIDEYWDRVMLLHKAGINIFIFDYKGYGKSEGELSEQEIYEDSKTALNYVKSRAEYNADSLCYYGYSLGNVASIYLASEVQDPLCLFSEAPFASANSLIQGSLILDAQSRWLTDGEFDNVAKIKDINTPFMLFYGEDDDFVRYRDNGKLVYKAAPNPKELILVPNALHNDVPYVMGIENYLNKITSWIEQSK